MTVFPKPFDGPQLLASLKRAHVEPEHGPTILVVDDQPDARKLAERTLKKLGYAPVCLATAEEALEQAKSDPPAAIVLDLMMPGMDGREFLRRLRRTKGGRATPVVVWTVKDLTPDEREELMSPVQAVIRKTDGPQALVTQLAVFVPAPVAETTSGG